MSVALAAVLLAACGPRGDAGSATAVCEPSSADTMGWRRAEGAGLSLLLPPGYRPDPVDGAGGEAASWTLPAAGGAEPAGRITVQSGAEVPELGGTEEERAGLNDFHGCLLAVGRDTVQVASAWLDDPTLRGGRAWQTVARWPRDANGLATGVYLVADGEAEHRRLRAVLPTVRRR